MSQEVQEPNPAQYPPVQAVKVSRNQTQYMRQQKGHSLILHLIFGGFALYIPTIYFAVSPNHYWHA